MTALLLAALQALSPISTLAREVGHSVYLSTTIPTHLELAISAWLADDAFRAQLAAAHALTINIASPERAHVIFFNPALESQYAAFKDELLAHEIGHAWLDGNGFRSLPFIPGREGCIAIHAADIPQHEILRREMHRRQIPYDAFWQNTLRLSALAIETNDVPARLSDCTRMIAVSQWLDLRLGAKFPDTARVEAAFRARHAALVPVVDRVEALIRESSVDTPAGYRFAVASLIPILSAIEPEAQ